MILTRINRYFDDRMLSTEPHFGNRVYPVPVSEYAVREPGIPGSRKERVKDARSSQVGLRPWRLAPQFPHDFVYMGLWGVNWPQHFRSLIRCLHGAICIQRHDI